MDKSTNWVSLAYLLLITGVILWWAVTYKKNFFLQQKEKEKMQIEMENLRRNNVALIEENQKLRDQVKLHNTINFSILNSLVEQYSSLKNQNVALKKENEKTKKDLTTATSNEKHIIMKIE